jgi:hypothetical protein
LGAADVPRGLAGVHVLESGLIGKSAHVGAPSCHRRRAAKRLAERTLPIWMRRRLEEEVTPNNARYRRAG